MHNTSSVVDFGLCLLINKQQPMELHAALLLFTKDVAGPDARFSTIKMSYFDALCQIESARLHLWANYKINLASCNIITTTSYVQ